MGKKLATLRCSFNGCWLLNIMWPFFEDRRKSELWENNVYVPVNFSIFDYLMFVFIWPCFITFVLLTVLLSVLSVYSLSEVNYSPVSLIMLCLIWNNLPNPFSPSLHSLSSIHSYPTFLLPLFVFILVSHFPSLLSSLRSPSLFSLDFP